MNYNNIVFWGDSLTFGARTYGCFPMYLVDLLNSATPYNWRAINRGVNGYTARDLWFKVNWELEKLTDTYLSCVLIGTNDCSELSDSSIFKSYLQQLLDAIYIKKGKRIYLGEIPGIVQNAHPFFPKETIEKRIELNNVINEICSNDKRIELVRFDLSIECFEDSVHFSEKGNMSVAKSFFTKIINS
ncbi:MAG TPA: SGNH/GDSL hydrolase family protein [Ignavibacteria bacterium]|nr:SGNH/GDSL hydrolase family protein [Ignavibacteria bacterium]HMR00499.1 SGNH/GDSL hydrolase family protein [Ignavibacteria bacterium]